MVIRYMANRSLFCQRGADGSWSQHIISSSATEAMVDDLQNQQLVPSSEIINDSKVDRPHYHRLSAQPSVTPMSSPSGSVRSDQICLTPEMGSTRDGSTKISLDNPERLSTDNLTGDLPLLAGIDCQTTSASLKRSAAEESMAIEHPNRKAPSPDDCGSGNIEHKDPNLQIDDCFKGKIGDLKSQLISRDALHSCGIELYLGMVSQPGYSPISQQQADAEVKSIYAGLVMAEAKCIKIDAQKAARPEEPLSTEQWQALVVLHRTLLYQHHDFLMATQHPSGSPALPDLATRYLMPMRIWKHGIHAFLDVLRHRRPESHEYMLAFIYMAYQMMSLFLETVPGLIDTWIEYLGDLARFRMAIEEDREVRTIWGGIAERWYVMAADRHPSVGRLYHHAGALVRPSLHKFYLYSRALTSVVPFLNTRESLKTLCSSVKTGEQGSKGRSQSAEAMIMRFHAGVFAGREHELTKRDCNAALALLKHESRNEIANCGVALAVTNIAALFGFGTPDNVYRQLFDLVQSRDVLDSHPSQGYACISKTSIAPMLRSLKQFQPPQEAVHHFCYNSFNDIIRRTPSKESLIGFLPYLHIMLVFFTSLNQLQSRLDLDHESRIRLDGLSHTSDVDWFGLSRFLNLIAGAFSISPHTEAYANSDTFPRDGAPLFEDYMIRGLVWAQWYFATDWFANIEDDDGSRCLEDDSKEQHRAARVLYLGMILAQRSELLSYDRKTKRFSGVQASNANDTLSAAESPCSVSACSGDVASIENDYIIVSKD